VFFLQVALSKKLYEQEVCPKTTNIERLCRVWDVRHVEHHHDCLLLVWSFVRGKLFQAYYAFKLGHVSKVLGNVCAKDRIDHEFAHAFVVIGFEFMQPVITVFT
jgi:hypothetical protein